MVELRNSMKRMPFFLAILWVLLISSNAYSQNDPWKKVEEGLYWAEFYPSQKSLVKDSRITIVKINPKFYSFKLLSASDLGKTRMTAKDWCLKHNLISSINAGMYQEDGLRNVGYMKNFSHINNPRLSSSYKAVLAFNRTDAAVPEIQIIDLRCQAFEELKPKYQTFVQSIRMVSCQQENVWAKQDNMWSLAVLGMDKNGNGLFIFSESPYSVHDFINVLLSLPISLYNAMYLEGGAEASLYFSLNGVELDKVGNNGSGLNDSLVRGVVRAIPNVLGITKKTK
jgi:uncharacterized protein YigE (DUF2233 family)